MGHSKIGEKKQLLIDSVRFIQKINEGSGEGPVIMLGGIVNFLQSKSNIPDRDVSDLLVRIMDDPQYIDGKIYTTSPMGQAVLETLAEQIKNGQLTTQEQCNTWIFDTYKKVFNYIMDLYTYTNKDDSPKPTLPTIDNFGNSVLVMIKNAINDPKKGFAENPDWQKPYVVDLMPEVKQEHMVSLGKLKPKHRSRVETFFKDAETIAKRVTPNNAEKAEFITTVKSKLSHYKKLGELSDDELKHISQEIVKKVGPF